MANLIAQATGNFTDAATWGLVDTTSYNATTTSSWVLSTSYQQSNTFTPGAITIAKIAVRLYLYNGTAQTGTVTMNLRNTTDAVDVKTVTINVTDIGNYNDNMTYYGMGWMVFAFSSVTLTAGKAYAIQLRTSSSNQVYAYYNTGNTNWARMLMTTTAQAPANGDLILCDGGWTAAGATNSITVTMNNTDATLIPTLFEVGSGCILNYGNTASTNYVLKLGCDFTGKNTGTLRMGTVANPIPSTSTAKLIINSATDGGYVIYPNQGFTWIMQGATKTLKSLLTANKVATNTILAIDSTSGWQNSDDVAIASTTRTAAQCEQKTVSTVDSATQVTLSAGLTYDHLGTSPTEAEIINLTSNVQVSGADATHRTYIRINGDSTFDWDYGMFQYIGNTTSGIFNTNYAKGASVTRVISNCIFRDSGSGLMPGSSMDNSGKGNMGFYNCVGYNLGSAVTGYNLIGLRTSTETSLEFDGNWFMYFGGATTSSNDNYGAVWLGDMGGVFKNNRLIGCAQTCPSIRFDESAVIDDTRIKDNIIHSGAGYGLSIYIFNDTNKRPLLSGWINGFTIWRMNNYGIHIYDQANYANCTGLIKYKNCTLFGNATGNMYMYIKDYMSYPIIFEICNINSDASFTTGLGIQNYGMNAISTEIYLKDTNIGNQVQHSTYDIAGLYGNQHINVINGDLGSDPTKWFTNQSTRGNHSWVRFHKKAEVATDFRSYYCFGTITSETTIRHTASGYSWKMTPGNNSNIGKKLVLPGPTETDTFKSYVVANTQVTVTAWVRKDGSYTGSAPRLVMRGNMIAGVDTDVIDPLSVAADNWEQLSVSDTPTENGFVEFYIDCDGAAGNIYVDDIDVTQP